MKFEKIKTNDTVEYFINDKPVPKDTYNILANDDSINKISHNKSKMTVDEYNDSEFNVDYNDTEYGEDCECEYQDIYDIVSDIKELDDDLAIEMLLGYIEQIEHNSYISAIIDTYNQLGSNMIKTAGVLENKYDCMDDG